MCSAGVGGVGGSLCAIDWRGEGPGGGDVERAARGRGSRPADFESCGLRRHFFTTESQRKNYFSCCSRYQRRIRRSALLSSLCLCVSVVNVFLHFARGCVWSYTANTCFMESCV